jgi:hypothetical protein
MTTALWHCCRNPHCRAKLSEPTDYPHHAFCCRGCHASFYRSRCLVCEEPMRRKNERQRVGSGHKRCSKEYRRFPGAYEHLGYYPSQDVIDPLKNPANTGSKTAPLPDRPASCPAGWSWEAETDSEEHRLKDRDGKVAARLWAVGTHWYLLEPQSIPRQSAPDLESAKRMAVSFALVALPVAAASGAAASPRKNGFSSSDKLVSRSRAQASAPFA